jgi:RNA polymerase sigma-70 factor (ECF subfamily)
VNEPDLIRRSKQGDRAAFESLLRLWARPIYAWLLPHVKDVHRAEDLTQETLLRAWKSISALDDPATFKGWIFAIAGAVMIDGARFDSRSRRSRLRTEPLREDTTEAPPIDTKQEEILHALAQLPAAYREALSLRFLSGLAPAEIEKRLGISNGSLRGLLHRGLRMLREELAPDDTFQEIKP